MVDAISNTPTRRLVIAPNASLTRAQAQWCFLAMCGVSFSVALFFMTLGLWPVLPFAGLEMAALGTALYASVKRTATGKSCRSPTNVLRSSRVLLSPSANGNFRVYSHKFGFPAVFIEMAGRAFS